jgi:hypothetical protein
VWCAVSRRRVVGPRFFTETVTAERRQKIQQFIALVDEDEQVLLTAARWGKSSHRSRCRANFLKDRLISRGLWPPRFPHLSPRLPFVELLKRKCVQNNPLSLNERKQHTRGCILNVTTETRHKVATNMWKRMDACTAEDGRHFQHLLYCKRNFNCKIKTLCTLTYLLTFNFFFKFELRRHFGHPVQFVAETVTHMNAHTDVLSNEVSFCS